MDLQALYDLKERLEHAAIAGTGLLQEDFRLKRAVEALSPLAAASPVFGKIASATEALLSAPAEGRGKQLLDVLALVDAVAYTQGTVDVPGELTPIGGGDGTYIQASYSQLHPLLTALTTTGGGRMEVVQSAWENHPGFFTDFRVLPVLIADLGDSYGELAELNAKILGQSGPAVLPLLKQGFDPAGKMEMARRVEAISAIQGAEATPWLREVLPAAKKDVRAAVITALGNDPDNIPLLLDLAKTERNGGNRDAVLKALVKQDGDVVRAFWVEELERYPTSALFLHNTDTEWSGELAASHLRARLEKMLEKPDRITGEDFENFSRWCQIVRTKTTPAMLDFWRWADEHMEEFDGMRNEKGNSVFAGVKLTDTLRDCLRLTDSAPLREFCLGLFDGQPNMTRYLHISFHAALLTRPAAEVYEKYSPYLLTKKPLLDAERKKTLNTVLLRALGETWWYPQEGRYVLYGGQPLAEPLDQRWILRLIGAVYTDVPKTRHTAPFSYYWEDISEFDQTLMQLVGPAAEEYREPLILYLRKRLEETGQAFTYSRWLIELGGSPKGILGKAIKAMKKGKYPYLNHVWGLLNEASKALPAGEAADLCQEVLDTERFLPTSNELFLAKKVLPWTIEQLRAGKPFPEWDEWWEMRK